MEVFIFLAARFLTVSYALAGTLHGENVSLVAPFALSDEGAALVLVLECELRARLNLNDDDLLMEIVI
jgi:hypothetical protein